MNAATNIYLIVMQHLFNCSASAKIQQENGRGIC